MSVPKLRLRIEFVAKEWREVKQSTIRNCFRKSGFKPTEEPIAEETTLEEEAIDDLIQRTVNNAEDFETIDEYLECRETTTEEAIIEAIKSRESLVEADEDKDDDEDEEEKAPTPLAAINAINVLAPFLNLNDVPSSSTILHPLASQKRNQHRQSNQYKTN